MNYLFVFTYEFKCSFNIFAIDIFDIKHIIKMFKFNFLQLNVPVYNWVFQMRVLSTFFTAIATLNFRKIERYIVTNVKKQQFNVIYMFN